MEKKLPKDPIRRKYHDNKASATRRGIPFLLSFEEWLKLWTDSGHWHKRGQASQQYCLARYGDKGPYKVGNVRVITNRENILERVTSADTKAKISANRKGKGPKHLTAKHKRRISASMRAHFRRV